MDNIKISDSKDFNLVMDTRVTIIGKMQIGGICVPVETKINLEDVNPSDHETIIAVANNLYGKDYVIK